MKVDPIIMKMEMITRKEEMESSEVSEENEVRREDQWSKLDELLINEAKFHFEQRKAKIRKFLKNSET